MTNYDEEMLEGYDILRKRLDRKGIDIDAIKGKIKDFSVEIPSWIFGEFGAGRFSGYIPPGAARNVFEKFDDAAIVNKLTGATPRVSIHIGLDDPSEGEFEEIQVDSFKKLKNYAKRIDLDIGAVNPTYFLEGTHFGSLSSRDPEVRKRLIDHSLISAQVASRFGTGLLTLWFPDGSLYPGQLNMSLAERRMKASLREIYQGIPKSVRMLIEYKLFEPGTYHTLISSYSVASDLARYLGTRVGVLVDLGHHPHTVNVEHIVARMIENKIPGGIHFNSRYAADDDHAVEPNMQVFRVFHELVDGSVVGNPDPEKNWALMIDQCSTLENRIQAVLHSVDSIMVSYAKALIVDNCLLKNHQEANELLLANRTLLDAFLTDVRPIIYKARLEKDLETNPIRAFIESGYQNRINKERQRPLPT